MILRAPSRNLGPGESWGRWTEENIRTLSQQAIEASQSTDRSLRGVNASLSQLTSQQEALAALVVRLQEQNTTYVWEQTTPYSGYGPTQTISAPPWANSAIIVSGGAVNSSTITGGPSTITLMNFTTTPLIGPNEFDGTIKGTLQSNTVFPRQSYPQLLTRVGDNFDIFSRTFSSSVGSTGGSANVTFTHSITWIP